MRRPHNGEKGFGRDRAQRRSLSLGEQHAMGQQPDHLRPRGTRLHLPLPSGHLQGMDSHHERRHRLERRE